MEFSRAWIPATTTGMAVCSFALALRPFLIARRAEDAHLFDEQIRDRLKSDLPVYRFCGELIEAMARTGWCQWLSAGRIRTAVTEGGADLPMSPTQLAALFVLRCVLTFSVVTGIGIQLISFASAVGLAIVAAGVMWGVQIGEITGRARERQQLFTGGFPFAIDLAGIMMQAGADMRTAIDTIAQESAEPVVAEQFECVQKDLRDGRSLTESLADLEQRVPTTVVQEFVTSLEKSEELGTPLSSLFLNQAEQMRIRQSQWVENASGEAQVRISLPTMLIMIACMITICAPFLFGVVSNN